jgi:hypothetical protein
MKNVYRRQGGDVVITTSQRQKRKFITSVAGLNNYGKIKVSLFCSCNNFFFFFLVFFCLFQVTSRIKWRKHCRKSFHVRLLLSKAVVILIFKGLFIVVFLSCVIVFYFSHITSVLQRLCTRVGRVSNQRLQHTTSENQAGARQTSMITSLEIKLASLNNRGHF